MKKILLIGGTGFLGKNFIEFAQHKYQIIALTRQSLPNDSKATWVSVGEDIEDTIRKTIAVYHIDVVIHCAGRINGSKQAIVEDNVGITQHVVNALEHNPCPLIYVSSVAAIGQLGRYGQCKYDAEQVITLSSLNDYAIFRSSLLYGKYDHTNVSTLINTVKRYPIVPILGGNRVKLQPLYVLDFIHAIDSFISQDKPGAHEFLIAGPEQVPLKTMVQLIQHNLKRHNLLLTIPLTPVQWICRHLSGILSRFNLPVQQIATLHDHPKWEDAKSLEVLNISLLPFKDGLREMLL